MSTPPASSSRPSRGGFVLILAAATIVGLGLVVWLVLAAGRDEPIPVNPIDPMMTPAMTSVDISQIADAPGIYRGEIVEVPGTVAEPIAPRVLKVTDPLVPDRAVLVAFPAVDQDQPLPTIGETVQVRGEVRVFAIGAAENTMGVDLDDSRFDEWIGEALIVAQTIEPLQP